jgi:hypothetical protein
MVNKGGINKVRLGRVMYRPIDNSWARCLNNKSTYYLAGTSVTPSQVVEVLLGPYLKDVGISGRSLDFIIVKDRHGLLHEILYNECAVTHE